MSLSIQAARQAGFEKVAYMENHLVEFPHTTKNGAWLTHKTGHWTGGFWIGLLWLKSLESSNVTKEQAVALRWATQLRARRTDNKTHDQGFIFGPSCILGNRICGTTDLVEMALCGANNMVDLYKEKAGLILAWDEPNYEGVAIVDTIMNLPLLLWAIDHGANPVMKEIAVTVANNIAKHHVRSDYSTIHKVRWDTSSYEIVERSTHQGHSPDSCWSRGQAWALYGFANMYRHTGDSIYIRISTGLAEYFWANLDDEVALPKWDFHFKNQPNQPFDSSAASIAAAGMLLLAEMLRRRGDLSGFELWVKRGTFLLSSLQSNCMYSDITKYGILEKATVDKPHNSGIGESTMYGDYYFMEALYRLSNIDMPKSLDLLY